MNSSAAVTASRALGVVRAGPGELLLVALAEEVRHHRRVQVALARRRGVEEAAALRRAQPLVAVADVPRHALRRQRIQPERQHARRVCAVHQHRHAARAAQAHDLLERRHRRQRREDVVDDRQARAAGERRIEGRRHRLRPRQRPGHARLDKLQPVAIGDEARRVLHARIGVVGDDDAAPRRARSAASAAPRWRPPWRSRQKSVAAARRRRSPASRSRAARSACGSSSTMKRTGSRSIASRQRAWAASTCRGAAPKEPWLRK
jgi:hypothetical protein